MLYTTIIHSTKKNNYEEIYVLLFFYHAKKFNKLYKLNQINMNTTDLNKEFKYLYYRILITCFLMYFHIHKIRTLNKVDQKFNILNSSFIFKSAQLHYKLTNYNVSYLFKFQYKLAFFRYLYKKFTYITNNVYLKNIKWRLRNNKN